MNTQPIQSIKTAIGQSHSLPTIVLTPAKEGIVLDGGTLDLLIRVQAPGLPAAAQDRAPLHLALVIDHSGSMSGQPLHEALRCAEYIVTHLSPRDKAAIVLYDTNVETLVPLTTTKDPTPFIRALKGVREGGSTALHAGWLEGAKHLAPHTKSASLSHVLLLSDGQANEGLTDINEIASQCKQLAQVGVSTTTIGLGRHFNEDLMVNMARQGGGQHYYGQTAEDLQDAFSEELALVQALYARHLTATLIPGRGVIVEVRSVPGATTNEPIPLSDLAFGAEVFLLVRLHYTAKPAGNHALLSVVVKGEQIGGTEFRTSSTILELPAIPSATWNALPTEELVTRRNIEIETANVYDGVRSALKRHDKVEAERLLVEARTITQNNEWAEASVVQLETLMRQDTQMAEKEALFHASKMRHRQAAPNEAASPAPVAGENVPIFLRRKAESGKKEE